MDSIVQMICGDAECFTPQMLVSLILFALVLECIAAVAYALTSWR